MIIMIIINAIDFAKRATDIILIEIPKKTAINESLREEGKLL